MAIELTTPPPLFAYIGNPIFFVLKDAVSGFKRFEYYVGNAEPQESERFEAHYRDASNQATIEIQLLLQTFFSNTEYPLPDLEASDVLLFANNTVICRPYTLYANTIYNTPEESHSLNDNFYCVRGGIAHDEFPNDTTFESEIVILTKLTDIESAVGKPEFLYFLKTANTTTGTQNIKIEITLADYTIQTEFIDLPTYTQQGKVSCIDVSYSKVVTPYVSEQALAYRIRVEERNLSDIVTFASEWINYDVNAIIYNQSDIFLFVNSAGGISTLRTVGEKIKTLEIESQTAKRYLRPNYALPESSTFVTNITGNKRTVVNTGYSEDWEGLWQDFVLSNQIYHLIDNTLHPIQIATKKLTIENDDLTELPNMQFEFEYLYNSNFY